MGFTVDNSLGELDRKAEGSKEGFIDGAEGLIDGLIDDGFTVGQ